MTQRKCQLLLLFLKSSLSTSSSCMQAKLYNSMLLKGHSCKLDSENKIFSYTTTMPGNKTFEGTIIGRHFLRIYQWINLRGENHPKNYSREEIQNEIHARLEKGLNEYVEILTLIGLTLYVVSCTPWKCTLDD